MMNLLKKLAACGLSLTMILSVLTCPWPPAAAPMTPPPAKAAVSPSSI